MVNELENTAHFFLWGFDNNGEIFVDARITILEKSREEVSSVKGVLMRQRFNPHLNASIIWLPKGEPFEIIVSYVQMYNEFGDTSVLKKLKEAVVKVEDIIRQKEENNALDFILHGR